MNPLMRLVTVATLPVALLISMTHLAQAEHAAGDGFTAGIISALGLTLQYLAIGSPAVRRRLERVPFQAVAVAGIAVALAAGSVPLLWDGPFLGTRGADLAVPLLGSLHVAPSMLFDVGVYLAVLGGAMTAMSNLRRRSE